MARRPARTEQSAASPLPPTARTTRSFARTIPPRYRPTSTQAMMPQPVIARPVARNAPVQATTTPTPMTVTSASAAPCAPVAGQPSHSNTIQPKTQQFYALPGSQWNDPPYAWQTATWPYPRAPWAYESETRAAGTGLIWGPAGASVAPPPSPCGPCG